MPFDVSSGYTPPSKKKKVLPAPSGPGFGGLPDFSNLPGGAGANYVAPTFAQILANDPMYQAAIAGLGAQSVSDRASLTAARQRALIQFGAIPNFPSYAGVGDVGADITPGVRSLADQNTAAGLSTEARLAEADKIAQQQLVDSLAARGMYRSGALGSGLGKEQLDYTRQQYDATQKLLDYLAGVQTAFTQAENARIAAENAAKGDALNRAAASNPVVPTPPGGFDIGYGDTSSTAPITGGSWGFGGGGAAGTLPPGWKIGPDGNAVYVGTTKKKTTFKPAAKNPLNRSHA